jgi:hypothetical protein
MTLPSRSAIFARLRAKKAAIAKPCKPGSADFAECQGLTEAAAAAVREFLKRTAVRKCPTRDAMVAKIASARQPSVTARRLLEQHGARDLTVTGREVRLAVLDCLPFDPVFRPRVRGAVAAADAGAFEKADLAGLLRILRSAWNPWSDADTHEARAEASALKEAAGCSWRRLAATAARAGR